MRQQDESVRRDLARMDTEVLAAEARLSASGGVGPRRPARPRRTAAGAGPRPDRRAPRAPPQPGARPGAADGRERGRQPRVGGDAVAVRAGGGGRGADRLGAGCRRPRSGRGGRRRARHVGRRRPPDGTATTARPASPTPPGRRGPRPRCEASSTRDAAPTRPTRSGWLARGRAGHARRPARHARRGGRGRLAPATRGSGGPGAAPDHAGRSHGPRTPRRDDRPRTRTARTVAPERHTESSTPPDALALALDAAHTGPVPSIWRRGRRAGHAPRPGGDQRRLGGGGRGRAGRR